MESEPRPTPSGEQQHATSSPSDGLGASVPASALASSTAAPDPPTYLPLVTATRLLDGIVVGMAMATIAGVAWWAAVAFTQFRFAYGAVVVGFVVGQGVLIGARKGGTLPAIVAGLACLTALAVAEYFIQRSLTIDTFHAELPLWQGLSTAVDVVRSSLEAEPITGIFWGMAVIAAMISAGSRTRRPIL